MGLCSSQINFSMVQVAGGRILPRLFESMDKPRTFFQRFMDGVYSRWIFIIPSFFLFALFFLPLFALLARSINKDFFNDAFSEQAFKALRLSLITSTITTGCAI